MEMDMDMNMDMNHSKITTTRITTTTTTVLLLLLSIIVELLIVTMGVLWNGLPSLLLLLLFLSTATTTTTTPMLPWLSSSLLTTTNCREEDTWCVSWNQCVSSVRSCPPSGDSCEKYKKPIDKWDNKIANKTKLMIGLVEDVHEKQCKTTLRQKEQSNRLQDVINLYKP